MQVEAKSLVEIEVTFKMSPEEAGILMAMNQNVLEGDTEMAAQMRFVIFEALSRAGVSPS